MEVDVLSNRLRNIKQSFKTTENKALKERLFHENKNIFKRVSEISKIAEHLIEKTDDKVNFSNLLFEITKRTLNEIPAPVQEWDSLEDLISYSFNMEADLTASLQQLYSISERISDTRTNVFLDPIIEAQTKSEDEFANILGKVKFASNQPSAILLIDSDLKKK